MVKLLQHCLQLHVARRRVTVLRRWRHQRPARWRWRVQLGGATPPFSGTRRTTAGLRTTHCNANLYLLCRRCGVIESASSTYSIKWSTQLKLSNVINEVNNNLLKRLGATTNANGNGNANGNAMAMGMGMAMGHGWAWPCRAWHGHVEATTV